MSHSHTQPHRKPESKSITCAQKEESWKAWLAHRVWLNSSQAGLPTFCLTSSNSSSPLTFLKFKSDYLSILPPWLKIFNGTYVTWDEAKRDWHVEQAQLNLSYLLLRLLPLLKPFPICIQSTICSSHTEVPSVLSFVTSAHLHMLFSLPIPRVTPNLLHPLPLRGMDPLKTI